MSLVLEAGVIVEEVLEEPTVGRRQQPRQATGVLVFSPPSRRFIPERLTVHLNHSVDVKAKDRVLLQRTWRPAGRCPWREAEACLSERCPPPGHTGGLTSPWRFRACSHAPRELQITIIKKKIKSHNLKRYTVSFFHPTSG